jgi:hypothetical protein
MKCSRAEAVQGLGAILALCTECLGPPSGIGGHPSLSTHVLEAGEDPVFRCSGCGAAWRRRYVGQGTFSWTPVEDLFAPN